MTRHKTRHHSHRRTQAFESNSDQSSAEEGSDAGVSKLERVAHALGKDVLSRVPASRAAHRVLEEVQEDTRKRGVGILKLDHMRLSKPSRKRSISPPGPPISVRSLPPTSTPTVASFIASTPTASYLRDVQEESVPVTAVPKSRLVILDLDNTLLRPVSHIPDFGVVARPYLKTFIDYILHPDSPYQVAFWTFSGRAFGIAHLRSLHLGEIFKDDDLTKPLLAQNVAAFWGAEDSGLTMTEMMSGMYPKSKDLELMWRALNEERLGKDTKWTSFNSFLVDDQTHNAVAQPDSVIKALLFNSSTGPNDDFLLRLIAALEELSTESNVADVISQRGWNSGDFESNAKQYAQKGRAICLEMGIRVGSGKSRSVDNEFLRNISNHGHFGPPDDSVSTIDNPDGWVHLNNLAGCCQDPPHPKVVLEHGPSRVAEGMLLFPSELYEKEVAEPSRTLKTPNGKPLIVFDLDGTLYTRPPCATNPLGDPAPRPYLKTFLTWLFRSESPWTVAIGTGSMKATAVRCLDSLDLGLVGPKLVGPNSDRPEILNDRLVQVCAREDLGLSKADFNAYVSVVKDLNILWEHLELTKAGEWSPYNTVMIDDTASKLRGQPDNLINPPTFNYPLGPSRETSAALLDTLLLQLIGMLEELESQSNFAHYISKQKWWEGMNGREHEYVRKGLTILARANIEISAEGRGSVLPLKPSALEGTLDRAFEPSSNTSLRKFKIGTTVLPLARKNSGSTSSIDPACRFVKEEEALQGLDEKVQRKKDLKSRMSDAVKEWAG